MNKEEICCKLQQLFVEELCVNIGNEVEKHDPLFYNGSPITPAMAVFLIIKMQKEFGVDLGNFYNYFTHNVLSFDKLVEYLEQYI